MTIYMFIEDKIYIKSVGVNIHQICWCIRHQICWCISNKTRTIYCVRTYNNRSTFGVHTLPPDLNTKQKISTDSSTVLQTYQSFSLTHRYVQLSLLKNMFDYYIIPATPIPTCSKISRNFLTFTQT